MASGCGEFKARGVNKAATYKLVQWHSQLWLWGVPQDSHTYAFTLQQPMVVVVEGEMGQWETDKQTHQTQSEWDPRSGMHKSESLPMSRSTQLGMNREDEQDNIILLSGEGEKRNEQVNEVELPYWEFNMITWVRSSNGLGSISRTSLINSWLQLTQPQPTISSWQWNSSI